MPVIDLPTHRLAYQIDETDTGKPWLVFCNSLGTDLHMWDSQVAALAGHFRILRHDARGHGGSGAPAGPYALSDLGGDVIALLDALGIGRAHFCGLSIGGMIGQWLGIHAGARFDRMVFCATAARIGTAEGWQTRAADVRANGLSGLMDATAERWFTPAFRADHGHEVASVLARFAAVSPEGYAGCCAALAEADFHARLPEITNPVLAIAGVDDPVCPPADLQTIAHGVQTGTQVSLPGRHIVNIEAGDAFNTALLRFLAAG